MKKIVSFIIVLLLIAPMSFVFVGCGKDDDDGVITTNITNFTSIGVGYASVGSGSLYKENLNNSNQALSSVLKATPTADTNSKDSYYGKLVGLDENGNASEIVYKKNGKRLKFINLESCNQTERYIFLKFSKEPIEEKIDTYCLQYDGISYILDKTTGNMYELDFYYYLLLSYFGISASDCGDYFIVEKGDSFYKVGVENDDLVFREILRRDSLPGRCSIRLADKYGNCIVKTETNKEYILNNGKLKETSIKTVIPNASTNLDETCTIRAYDGKIYHNGYVLNELGEWEIAENVPDLTVLPREYMIYAEDNVEYYFSNNNYDPSTGVYYPYYNNIMKRIYLPDGTVKVESVPLDFTGVSLKNRYINAPYIYTVSSENVVSKISIITNEKTSVAIENVMIKSIEILGMGEVMFYGVNLNLETITGIIDANGNVSYTTKKPDFKVFYYVPLNKEIIG